MPKKRSHKKDKNISFDPVKNFDQVVKIIVELDSFITSNDGKLPQQMTASLTAEQRQKIYENTSQLANRLKQLSNKLAAEESSQLLQDAKQQASEFRKNLISTGKILPSETICQALGVTRQALSKAVTTKRLFALQFRGRNYYPAFFADPAFNRRLLERVCKTLGELDGEKKWEFFTTPKQTLEGATPLETLNTEEIESILKAAENFAELS